MNYPLFALGLGFLLGLKHATEADHLIAVTTIVSEQRSVARSALVGAMWGVGHTAALLAAGVVVILLEVTIPERVAAALEFCVSLMIVFLGTRVLFLALRAYGMTKRIQVSVVKSALNVLGMPTWPARTRPSARTTAGRTCSR